MSCNLKLVLLIIFYRYCLLTYGSGIPTDQSVTITLRENGTDDSGCLEGNTSSVSYPCRTLTYLLQEIVNPNRGNYSDNVTITIIITYSQQIIEHVFLTNPVNLIFKGIDNPILDFMNQNCIFYVDNFKNGTIYIEGLTITKVSLFRIFNYFSFTLYNCTVRESGAMNISSAKVNLINSKFLDNNANMKALFRHSFVLASDADHGLQVSGCIFKNNRASNPLIYLIDETFSVRVSWSVIISSTSFIDNYATCFSTFVLTRQTNLNGQYLIEDSYFTGNVVPPNSTKSNLFELTYFSNITKCIVRNVTLANNFITSTTFAEPNSILAFLSGVNMYSFNTANISNIFFFNNTGTPMYVESIELYSSGNFLFRNNSAIHGGALHLNGGRIYILDNATEVVFVDNIAILGGAIYIRKTDCNLITCTKEAAHASLTFVNNIATNLGDYIYIQNPECLTNNITSQIAGNCSFNVNNNVTDINRNNLYFTGPETITIQPDTNSTITLFPGQKIRFYATVQDFLDHNTSCVVQTILKCDEGLLLCVYIEWYYLQLNGDNKFLLTEGEMKTNLHLSSSNKDLSVFNPQIELQCIETDAKGYLKINLTDCPLGYRYSDYSPNSTYTCQCVQDDNVICNLELGVACIKRGYWFGRIGDTDEYSTGKCDYPYCKTQLNECSIPGYSHSYVNLPTTQDEQCYGIGGGILCKECRSDAVLTFEAVQCIPQSRCDSSWQPYIILILAVVFQFVFGFLLIIGIRTKFSIGIGYLYGPLFYLAFLALVPFGYYQQFDVLIIIISWFQSIFLLNLEIFGHIPWCFFPSFNPLLNYSFHFLGPGIIALVLLCVVLLARRFPRVFLSLQRSPIQSICLLIELSFWSISTTCIQILKPETSFNEVRVEFYPHLEYLKDPVHIVLWIISVLVILFVIVPFITVLLFSQLLTRRFNLNHIQPLLDEFQSVYKDKFRWYSGVYPLAWIILNINMPYLVLEVITISLATLHFLIQPYKNHWVNILDSLLFVDIIFLFKIVTGMYSTNPDAYLGISDPLFFIGISYILTLIPLSCLVVGTLWIFSKAIIIPLYKKMKILRNKKMKILRKRKQLNISLRETSKIFNDEIIINQFKYFDPSRDRESLVCILQEEENDATKYTRFS